MGLFDFLNRTNKIVQDDDNQTVKQNVRRKSKDNVSQVSVNGKHYTNLKGDVTIINNKVYVNGKPVDDLNECPEKNITIYLTGNINNLSVDCCDVVNITGDVSLVKTSSGDIHIDGRVSCGVESASGDITVDGDVTGNVSTKSGDVEIKNLRGNCTTVSGDIVTR